MPSISEILEELKRLDSGQPLNELPVPLSPLPMQMDMNTARIASGLPAQPSPDLMAQAQQITDNFMGYAPIGAPSVGDMTQFGLNMTPFVGDAMAIGDAKTSFEKGDIGMGAFNALTALPMIGDAAQVAKVAIPSIGALGALTRMMGRNIDNVPTGMTRQSGVVGYHGSPHKFDKFSMDNIGTGEGAQAYGHGLYFAESPDVGEQYARVINKEGGWDVSKALSDQPNAKVTNLSDQVKSSIDTAWLSGGEKGAKKRIASIISEMESFKYPQSDIDAVKRFRDSVDFSARQGNLYKVDIDDKALETFLDWDKPLSEQSANIQDIARNLNVDESPAMGRTAGVLKAYQDGRDVGVQATGQDLYRALADYGESSVEGSDLLHKQGIKGIRYLDGTSRSAGEGTSNYVTFDDDIIKILERNNAPLSALFE